MGLKDTSGSRFGSSCVAAGALFMLAGVILGAVGAHGLEGRLTPAQLASFESAAAYHQLHALGLLLVGVVAARGGSSRALAASAWLMGAGIVLFSGAIYLKAAGAPPAIGRVAPFGGLSFMAAWALLALHALRRRG